MAAINIPTRVQRKRTKGFRLPPNTLCCTRPSKWSNPWKITETRGLEEVLDCYRRTLESRLLFYGPDYFDELLRYDHLACYCPLDRPCHVDVLIEFLKAMQVTESCLQKLADEAQELDMGY